MASESRPSTARHNTERAKNSEVAPPQQQRYEKRFGFEEKCFLMHHANYYTDFESLCENFNIQFNTDRSLDSIERVLTRCSDDDFLMLTEVAEDYKKWYTEHPAKPQRPIILLGSRAMRTELRAYLAYHHLHGMGFADLKNSFNSTFPTETRDWSQITRQLQILNKENQLRTSLAGFSIRYPWHPEYQPITGTPAARAARARLDKGKSNANHKSNNQAAIAAQEVVMNQRTKLEEDSLAARRELSIHPAKSEERSLAVQWFLIVKCTDIIGRIITGSLSNPTIVATNASLAATVLGPATTNLRPSSSSRPYKSAVTTAASPLQQRPGHHAGRARSASPGGKDMRGEGGVKRERRPSL